MNIQQAYNTWSGNYDQVINKTRDLEGLALRNMLDGPAYDSVLEIGCGTGKNTEWLLTCSQQLTAADFSAEMLTKAKEKITASNVSFIEMDITANWSFLPNQFNLITCSLVLEHIENIDFIFHQASTVLKDGGLFYIGELHPFKQYQGSKARFEKDNEMHVVDCFIHNVSAFFNGAKNNNFTCIALKEWFDGDDKNLIPRLLTMIFQKAV